MQKHKLDTVQFYISHSCNLGCNNCLSYNNFAIKGHDKFEDWAKEAEAWSTILDPNDMSIIGGEPLSNPDVHNWVVEVKKLFPNCKDFKVCSNGVFINKHRDNILQWHKLGVILEIHSHSIEHYMQAQIDIQNIIAPNYTKQKTAPSNYPEYYNEDFDIFYIVNGKIFAAIAAPYEFQTMGVSSFTDNEWQMFESDPKLAHMICSIKDAHYIYKGKLYKCGLIVGAKEFVKTYNVKKTHADLINAYTPIDCDAVDVHEQIQNLRRRIPQCALCPTNITRELNKKIYSKTKIGLTNST